jgi:hypothetical protein
MPVFKHRNTLAIVETNQESQIKFYRENPIWIEVGEDKTKLDGVYANLSKDEIIEIAKSRQLNVNEHNTRKEIIEILEQGGNTEIEVVFDDNLIN